MTLPSLPFPFTFTLGVEYCRVESTEPSSWLDHSSMFEKMINVLLSELINNCRQLLHQCMHS